MRFILFSVAFLIIFSSVCPARNRKLTGDSAKKLLPQAAGISNADFEALSKNPQPSVVKSKSLSLILLALDVPKITRKNPNAAKDFRYLSSGVPDIGDIADAIWISKKKGYASFIQPKYIVDCTCESTTTRAKGVVTFKNKLYEGRIPFFARKTKEGWLITEFHLPNYNTKVVRGKNGVWKQEDLKDK